MTDKSNRPKAYSYLRFSTTEQLKGDSQRRQLALARGYADQHGLDLDETLTFRDLGVSAFRGKNVTEGALGAFLDAVDAGHVPPGSWLLVENLDRLSRDKVMPALMQFQSILERDVNVVTLQDGRIYTRSTLNDDPTALMLSVMSMYRANEESEVKSKRLRAAWQNKRDDAQANGTKLTGRCPAWLTLDKASGEFEILVDRAAVIEQIFELTLAGLGKGAIAKRFNTAGVPTFSSRGNGWHPSYIQKILDSEAVIGTFQPRKNRRPDGPPIPNYFPVIIEPATFLQARELRRDRRITGGRKGKTFSNMFGGMAECGVCGAPMHFINKGAARTALVCSNAKRGNGCKYVSWPYAPTEHFLLHGLQIVEFADLFPQFNDTAKAAIQGLEDDLLIDKEAVAKNAADLDTTVDLLVERPDSAALLAKLDDLEDAKVDLETALLSVEGRLSNARDALKHADGRHAETITALGDWLREGAEDEAVAYERRSQLHQLLRRTIASIIFTAPPIMGPHHGDIRIVFEGEPDVADLPEYTPIIRVDAGQRSAVADGVLHLSFEKTD